MVRTETITLSVEKDPTGGDKKNPRVTRTFNTNVPKNTLLLSYHLSIPAKIDADYVSGLVSGRTA